MMFDDRFEINENYISNYSKKGNKRNNRIKSIEDFKVGDLIFKTDNKVRGINYLLVLCDKIHSNNGIIVQKNSGINGKKGNIKLVNDMQTYDLNTDIRINNIQGIVVYKGINSTGELICLIETNIERYNKFQSLTSSSIVGGG